MHTYLILSKLCLFLLQKNNKHNQQNISAVVGLMLLCLLIAASPTRAQKFVHPGVLHTLKDLDRIKMAIAAEQDPIYKGFQIFADAPESKATYKMQGPFEEFGRNNSETPTHTREMHQDANAAYQNALMWYITGDIAHANKAIEILNGWASTMTKITGKDASLAASLDGFKLVNAAEILRYTDAGWTEKDIRTVEKWFKNVWYPILEPFALYANGNWDAGAIKAMMAIGVFINNRQMFDRAVQYYVNGSGNGRLTYYVVNEDGQVQESGRDQAHTMLGLGLLAEAAEAAWNQGIDLYGYANNRLLKGFEYTARYNLGQEVPYVPYRDRTGKYGDGGLVKDYEDISPEGRGEYRAVFEMIWNHYVNRRGLSSPYSKKFADQNRPEGATVSADHPGYGTLLFSRAPMENSSKNDTPRMPAGLFAEGAAEEIIVFWPKVRNTDYYTLQRASSSSGPFQPIGTNLKSTSFKDEKVKPGDVYYYRLTASNTAGESPASLKLRVAAGIPAHWSQQQVGNASRLGDADFDGTTFMLEGTGTGVGETEDRLLFTYRSMEGDDTITARLVWPLSSQRSEVGLMIRESLAAGAPHAAVQVVPNWSGAWFTRSSAGESISISGNTPIPEPYVFNNRLMKPYWLKLVRSGNKFTGFISPDAEEWTQVGSTTIPMKENVLVGFAVSSGMEKVSTTAAFDQVQVSGKSVSPEIFGKNEKSRR